MKQDCKCRVCSGRSLKKIIDLGKTPLANGLLTEAQLNKPEEMFPLELVFAMGLLFMNLFNYRNLFESGTLGLIMKPIDSPWVPLGLGLQLFRGLIFGIVLWPFKSVFLF